MTTTENTEAIADVLRRLDELEKNLADRIDVRTSEIVEWITGYSPHALRDFEQERDGLTHAEPIELRL